MKEFIGKLIGRLEEYEQSHLIAHDSELCKHCQGIDCLETLADCTICVMNKAIEIVQELEKEYKGGWIACSDRLPEKNGYYLVTQKRYSLDTHRLIRIETDYVRFEGGKWGRANYFEITAWQPLPQPYKENKNG